MDEKTRIKKDIVMFEENIQKIKWIFPYEEICASLLVIDYLKTSKVLLSFFWRLVVIIEIIINMVAMCSDKQLQIIRFGNAEKIFN